MCEQYGNTVGEDIILPLYKKMLHLYQCGRSKPLPYQVSTNIVGECLGAPVLQENVTFASKRTVGVGRISVIATDVASPVPILNWDHSCGFLIYAREKKKQKFFLHNDIDFYFLGDIIVTVK